MSNYFENRDLFLEPKVNQYGSHMVMTNVHKQNKTKYINIDTTFRDEYNNGHTETITAAIVESEYQLIIGRNTFNNFTLT